MAREGKKIHEYDLWTENEHGNRGARHTAVLRMKDNLKFSLEVAGLRFDGNSPNDLEHQAKMQLQDEHDLSWSAIILVDPDLEEGRLQFKRLFHAQTRSGKDVYRLWRFDGDDEQQHSKWNHKDIKTFERFEGASPGSRDGGPRLKDRELPYTAERWTAIVKLDQMLGKAQEQVSEKLYDLIRKGDFDAFLSRATKQGIPRIVFDEATKACLEGLLG